MGTAVIFGLAVAAIHLLLFAAPPDRSIRTLPDGERTGVSSGSTIKSKTLPKVIASGRVLVFTKPSERLSDPDLMEAALCGAIRRVL